METALHLCIVIKHKHQTPKDMEAIKQKVVARLTKYMSEKEATAFVESRKFEHGVYSIKTIFEQAYDIVGAKPAQIVKCMYAIC